MTGPKATTGLFMRDPAPVAMTTGATFTYWPAWGCQARKVKRQKVRDSGGQARRKQAAHADPSHAERGGAGIFATAAQRPGQRPSSRSWQWGRYFSLHVLTTSSSVRTWWLPQPRSRSEAGIKIGRAHV